MMQRYYIVLFIALLLSACGTLVNAKESREKTSMKKHHLSNGAFRNHADLEDHSSLSKFLKWQWEAPDVEKITFPLADNDPAYLKNNQTDSTLTWVGHSTFLIQHKGFNILTDPHFTLRASPVRFAGPKRFTQPGLSFEQLPHINVIIISHDHYDHLDLGSVVQLNKQQRDTPPLFVVPLKIGNWLSKQGIDNWVQLDWWESTALNGWTFTAVPVQHFSGRSLLRKNDTLWAGWVMQAPYEEGKEPQRLFFAGDTGYSQDFAEIGKRFGYMNVSIIPIGAYDPRWFMKDMHVNPEEAVQIHQDVGSRFSVGMHWGTFVLTDEPMDEPPKRLTKALDEQGLNRDAFQVMTHGETRNLSAYLE